MKIWNESHLVLLESSLDPIWVQFELFPFRFQLGPFWVHFESFLDFFYFILGYLVSPIFESTLGHILDFTLSCESTFGLLKFETLT